MTVPMWKELLYNFGFPVVITCIVLWFYWRKDENSVKRDVYDDMVKINSELRERVITMVKTMEELIEIQATTTQTISALRESVSSLCHLVDVLILMGGGKIGSYEARHGNLSEQEGEGSEKEEL
jgi:hypothetical protein